jgi:hypothetical protein
VCFAPVTSSRGSYGRFELRLHILFNEHPAKKRAKENSPSSTTFVRNAL